MPTTRSYLDYNASAPLLDEAREAVIAALDLANPSSVHQDGRAARAAVEAARRDVAALCGAKPEHVTFTSGATEAAATLLTPRYRMGRSPLRLSHLYVGATEHPCVLCGGSFGENAVTVVPVEGGGIISLKALAEKLAAHDRDAGLPLVAIQAANNETGVIQPVAEIAAIVKEAGGIFVVDAVQAAGRISLDISAGYADYLILSSHKIGGPKGAGAIVSNSDLMMPEPLIRGGGQEKGHRAGTEAVATIAGFGAAARVAREMADIEGIGRMRDAIEDGISQIAPDAVFHGRGAARLANTSFFTLPGMKAETAQIAFDLAGISLSAGSACSSGKVGPSHVLAAMGAGDGPGALRVSIGRGTSEADADRFLSALREIEGRRNRGAGVRAA